MDHVSDAVAAKPDRAAIYIALQHSAIHWASHWIGNHTLICPGAACPACRHELATPRASLFVVAGAPIFPEATEIEWLTLHEETWRPAETFDSAFRVGFRLARKPRRKQYVMTLLGISRREDLEPVPEAIAWQMLARLHRLPCAIAPIEDPQIVFAQAKHVARQFYA